MGGAETMYTGLNQPRQVRLDRLVQRRVLCHVALAPRRRLHSRPRHPRLPPAADGGRRGAPMTRRVRDELSRCSTQRRTRESMHWIVCGTAGRFIGVNRQFKEWLKTKNVQFTEQEVPDMAHVWPLWRQNLTDMAPRLFQAASRENDK